MDWDPNTNRRVRTIATVLVVTGMVGGTASNIMWIAGDVGRVDRYDVKRDK